MSVNISGADIVFASLIIGYFWYEVTRIRALRDVAKIAAEQEARPNPARPAKSEVDTK